MSVSKMKKLTVVAPRSDTDAIMRRLTRLRAVALQREELDAADEPLPSPASAAEIAEISARLARIRAAIPLLARHSKRRKPLFAPQQPISPEDFRADGRLETARKVVEEVERIVEGKAEAARVRDAAILQRKALLPYLSLDLPANFNGTDTTRFAVGALPGGVRTERIAELLGELPITWRILAQDSAGIYITVLYHCNVQDAALRALGGLGFVRAPLPDEDKTVVTLFDEATAAMERAEDTLRRLEARLFVLADKLGEVEILSDIEATALALEENKRALVCTEHCVVLSGWCPAAKQAAVAELLSSFCAAYRFEDPAPDEDVPVLLRNCGFAQSFEWVLGMYAYPKYGTFDPTLLMSIFYFLIFGLMFADAGYGITLMIACFSAVRFLHPRDSLKRPLLMFGYCGISCTLFGILLGSYFGNFPLAFMEYVLKMPPETMPRLSLLPAEAANIAVLFDPIQNPIAFLVLSLALGALHLVTGMAIKAFVLCKQGKVFSALFDIVAYWVLFAGLGALFLRPRLGAILCAVGAGVILLTAGRHKKGIPMKIAGGFLGLYDLINYASDLLSYSRILALGLAAGVIGQVVNILATLKGGSVLGFVLMILVFVLGHLLNLAINILGTFVHTSRLQYIEFFNKFYEEGGTPFHPMTPVEQYTKQLQPPTDIRGSEAQTRDSGSTAEAVEAPLSRST